MKVDFSERTARVCFNTNEWRRPSGPSGKAISKCFEKQRGFGFDEWQKLSNPDVFVIEMDACGARFERIWS